MLGRQTHVADPGSGAADIGGVGAQLVLEQIGFQVLSGDVWSGALQLHAGRFPLLQVRNGGLGLLFVKVDALHGVHHRVVLLRVQGGIHRLGVDLLVHLVHIQRPGL